MITYTFRVTKNNGDWYKTQFICENNDVRTFEQVQQHVLFFHEAASVQLLTSTVH